MIPIFITPENAGSGLSRKTYFLAGEKKKGKKIRREKKKKKKAAPHNLAEGRI